MQITVHQTPTELSGKDIEVGSEAPAARITKLDNTQNVIGMIAPNVQLFIILPSLKTEVCSLGAKRFSELLKEKKKVDASIITTDDIDFLQGYVKENDLGDIDIVHDTQRQFGKKYGILISEGKLKDRLARAVFIIDRDGVLRYKEIVPEVTDEVDYDKCTEALDEVLSEKKKGHTHEEWMSVG